MKSLGITGYVRRQKNPDTEGFEHNGYAKLHKPCTKFKKKTAYSTQT